MKTRSITEGAMLSAVTVILTIIGEYFSLPALIIPVPLTLLVYRHGTKLGITMSFVSALIAGLIAGHVLSGVTIIIWGFLGIALGLALREKFSFPQLMGVGVVANLVVTGLNVLFYSLLFGSNLFEDMLQMISTSTEQILSLYQSLGVAEEMISQYEQILSMYPILIKWGLPALLLLSSVILTYINLAVIRLILKRMGDKMAWVRPFIEWRAPSYFSLGLVLGLILMGLGGLFPESVQMVGLNLLLIFFPVYFVVGLSVVWHYFHTRKVHTILRVIFVYLALTMGLLLYVVVFIGVLDAAFNFRKLDVAV